MSNEIAKPSGTGLDALSQWRKTDGPITGMESLDASDIKMPKYKMLQPTSPRSSGMLMPRITSSVGAALARLIRSSHASPLRKGFSASHRRSAKKARSMRM